MEPQEGWRGAQEVRAYSGRTARDAPEEAAARMWVAAREKLELGSMGVGESWIRAILWDIFGGEGD